MTNARAALEIKSKVVAYARKFADDVDHVGGEVYQTLLEEIGTYRKDDFVPAILDAYEEESGAGATIITFIIKDLENCPTLPHETILRMERAKEDPDSLYKLLFLYSTYLFNGYMQLVSPEALLSKYQCRPGRPK